MMVRMDAKTPEVSPNFITEIIDQDLKNGKYSQVVTRFPPEPSGYAHLGHVFASFLDFQTARQCGGRYHLRMDDTNPELATQEYADAIADDLRWLGWDWGEHLYFASDNFDEYYRRAVQLIEQGDAYVESVSPAEMARLRGDAGTLGRPSPYRERSVAENLDLFERMKNGEFADGEHVLRAKIDLESPNIKLRDPVLYRIFRREHYRAGNKWCIYPMYDFQHPLQDALEGVTHSMCSLEFVDNRAIYDWVVDKLCFSPRPHQYEFGRRGLEYTVTSKRKLRRLIEEGRVSGWDDPRMPTLRAQRRLGVRPSAVLDFASQIGVNRTNRTVDLAVYENAVRGDLNAVSFRAMAVTEPLRLRIENWPANEQTLRLPLWPHDVIALSEDGLMPLPNGERVAPEAATRCVRVSGEVFIEQSDWCAGEPPKGWKRLTLGGTVRLRGLGVVRAERVEEENGETVVVATLLNENASAGGVIHWVSAAEAVQAELRLYDRLFSVAHPEAEEDWMQSLNPHSLRVKRGLVEAWVAETVRAHPETRFQFERLGYFWADPVDSRAEALVFNRIITLKDGWSKSRRAAPEAPKTAKQAKASAPAKAAAPLSRAEQDKFDALTKAGVGNEDALTLAKNDQLHAFFVSAEAKESAAQVAAWIVNDLGRPLKGEHHLRPEQLTEAAALLKSGQLSKAAAKTLLQTLAKDGGEVAQLAEALQKDTFGGAKLRELLAGLIAAHPDKAAELKAGKTALQGFFVGQAMRESKGKADAAEAARLLGELLS